MIVTKLRKAKDKPEENPIQNEKPFKFYSTNVTSNTHLIVNGPCEIIASYDHIDRQINLRFKIDKNTFINFKKQN